MNASYSTIGRKIKLEVAIENLELADKFNLVQDALRQLCTTDEMKAVHKQFLAEFLQNCVKELQA